MTLAECLADELRRNCFLLKEYEKIPTGMFAVISIRHKIERGIKALADGDGVEGWEAYKELQESC